MRLASSDDNWFPIWTPDGKRVTFSRTEKSGRWRILSVSADGSGEAKSLFESDKPLFASSWSPSGDLAFVRQDWATLASDVWVLHTNDGKSEPILNTPFFEAYPEFSPDGRWLAFGSTSGQEQIEVYVQSYPGGNGKIKISGGVGWEPFWSRDGRRLYFTSNTRRGDEFQGEEYRSIGLMVVDVAAGPTFGPARVLLDYYGYELGSSPVRGEDLHPDGLRFLAPADIFGGKPVLRAEIPEAFRQALETSDPKDLAKFEYWLRSDAQRRLSPSLERRLREPATVRINIVQNWLEELKSRVPTGK